MQLLVGLGNPGDKYQDTRHNIGFRFLDVLANHEGLRFAAAPRFRAQCCNWELPDEKVMLVKPQTFMNHSGEAVGQLARYYQVATSDIFVVYDDLDLPAGKLRIRKSGGHGGHNGLKSLNQHLDGVNYTRIRIGIGRPEFGDVTPWVLGRASEAERASEHIVFDALLPEIKTILDGEAGKAVNRIHLALGTTD
ncbi:MAG: aminoacyl-tRNA hydrolase [Mariprofundaceae bacterium]|nr:aminoacyl-tRNA hydrolase [Mariprofundaceae bacterium]